ncbi:hypothetical protein Btru_072305 [Bulinus truncatus]|nr:hypothetical protein Btru_072305 [Bulinus truncatus]
MRVNNARYWSLKVTSLFVLWTMAVPTYPLTVSESSYIYSGPQNDSDIRDVTNETLTSNRFIWTTSPPPNLSPSSAISLLKSVSPGLDTANALQDSALLSASHKPEVSFLQTPFFIYSTPFLLSSSSNKNSQDLILPSHTAPPDVVSATDLPDEILKPFFSDSLSAGHPNTQQSQSSSVTPKSNAGPGSISASFSSGIVVDMVTPHSMQMRTTAHFDDVINSTFSHQTQTTTQPTYKINSASTFSAEWVTEHSKNQNLTIYFSSASHNIRHADDYSPTPQGALHDSTLTSAQPPIVIQPTRVYPSAKTHGVFSDVLSLPDAETWSLTGMTSILSSSKLLLATQLVSSPTGGQESIMTSSEPPVNPTTNLMVALDDKEWAVPVVAALAGVTFLAILALLIVCGHHCRTRRLRRNISHNEGQHQPTRNHTQTHLQKPKPEWNQLPHPQNTKNGYGSAGIDRTDQQKPPAPRSYGRQARSGMLRNGQQERFEMPELEGGGRAKMTEVDSVDNGEEWTTKFVQETRMYDYGLGDYRTPLGGRKVTGKNEAGSPRFKPPLGPAPGSPGRNPSPSFGAAPRFPQMSPALSLEEARLGDALHRAKKITPAPPLKPKRVYAPQPNQPRCAGFENKGFQPEPASARSSGSVDLAIDRGVKIGKDLAETEYYGRRGENHDQQGTHVAPDVMRRHPPSVDERRQRILKCTSYDESKLAADAKPPENKMGPTRKISTVSEPAREYLTVPESSIAKSRWMYPSVDNLAQNDGVGSIVRLSGLSLAGSGLDQGEQSVKEDGRRVEVNSHGSQTLDSDNRENSPERYKVTEKVPGAGSSGHDPSTKPASDFIFPIISKATKKILEVRNSRKLVPTSSNESSDQFEHTNGHGPVQSPELDTHSADGHDAALGSSPPSPVKYGPIVPKIILTNETEDEGGESGLDEGLRRATPSPSRGARRIARANNPFLIEFDKPASKKSEKFRRSSAPSMPFNLDPNVHLATTLGMTRSSSGELLRAPSVDASGGGALTLSSWSRQFYNLVNRVPENDPDHRQRVKKMIDDRYEALFGRGYPDVAGNVRHDGGGARAARLANRKIKASSLDRDSNLTHSLITYLADRGIEPESLASELMPDFRRYSDQPWRPCIDLPVGSESNLRKSLAHGTDGYDNLASKSGGYEQNYTGAPDSVEEGMRSRVRNVTGRPTTVLEDKRVTDNEIDRETHKKVESAKNEEGASGDEVNAGSHVTVESGSRREVPSISSSHRLDSVTESKSSLEDEYFKPTYASYREQNEDIDSNINRIEDINTGCILRGKTRPADGTSGESTVDKLSISMEAAHKIPEVNVGTCIELPPSKMEVANDAGDIHALIIRSPRGPAKLKVADGVFHRGLNEEEGSDPLDASHDSLPSSRDVSLVDTSDEESKDLELEIDYFDSLLSSTV